MIDIIDADNVNKEEYPVYPAPTVVNWHRTIVSRAQLYAGTPYQIAGRSYSGIDAIGMILGTCYAIGRPLGECVFAAELIARLTPVRTPLPGDVIYCADSGLLGIVGFGRNRVITAVPEKGYTLEHVPIYKRKWGFYSSKTANEEYDYYCLLRGAWHHGTKVMGDTRSLGNVSKHE